MHKTIAQIKHFYLNCVGKEKPHVVKEIHTYCSAVVACISVSDSCHLSFLTTHPLKGGRNPAALASHKIVRDSMERLFQLYYFK